MSGREHFRVAYPIAERPEFRAPEFICVVVNVSESGMTLAPTQGSPMTLRSGDRVAGTVYFRYAAAADIDGVVLRVSERTPALHAVVHFDQSPLPWASIQAEERALLGKYPR